LAPQKTMGYDLKGHDNRIHFRFTPQNNEEHEVTFQ